MERLKQVMTQRGLGDYFERMKHLTRNAIHVNPIVVGKDEIPVGSSKFGGIPDLPDGFAWPRREEGNPLVFLCQFNLAELAPYDRDGLLPGEGMLYFFYDVEPMPTIIWCEWDGWAVRYESGRELKRQRGPEDVPGYFSSARLELTATPELPFLNSGLVTRKMLEDGESWDLFGFTDRYAATGDDSTDVGTKLLGHTCQIHGGGAEGFCEEEHRRLFGTEGCRHEEPGDPSNAARWLNLFQLDSHENVGWIWGNGYGRVCFWIEEDDLKHRRFDRVMVLTDVS